jgi:hypothetical protein
MSWAVLHALVRHGGRVEINGELIETRQWVSFTTGDGKFRVAIATRERDFPLKEVEIEPVDHRLMVRSNAIQFGLVARKRSHNPLFERIVAFNNRTDLSVKICAMHTLNEEGELKTSTIVQRCDVPFARALEVEDETSMKMRIIANIGLDGLRVLCRKVD